MSGKGGVSGRQLTQIRGADWTQTSDRTSGPIKGDSSLGLYTGGLEVGAKIPPGAGLGDSSKGGGKASGLSNSDPKIEPHRGVFDITNPKTLIFTVSNITKDETGVCTQVLAHPKCAKCVNPADYCDHSENYHKLEEGNKEWEYRKTHWEGTIKYDPFIYGAPGIKIRIVFGSTETKKVADAFLEVENGANQAPQIVPRISGFDLSAPKLAETPLNFTALNLKKEQTKVCLQVLAHPKYAKSVNPADYCDKWENYHPFSFYAGGSADGSDDWRYNALTGQWLGAIKYNKDIYGVAGIKVRFVFGNNENQAIGDAYVITEDGAKIDPPNALICDPEKGFQLEFRRDGPATSFGPDPSRLGPTAAACTTQRAGLPCQAGEVCGLLW